MIEIFSIKELVAHKHTKEKVVETKASNIKKVPNISKIQQSGSDQLNSLNIYEIAKHNIATNYANIGHLFVSIEPIYKNFDMISFIQWNW